MAIQYAGGTNRNSVVAADTRLLIVNNLKAELVAAGWGVASGASGDWKLDSATTPAGHKCRLRLYDPGSNAAQIFLMNQVETLNPTLACWLVNAAALTYRIIANQYQFFAFVPGSTTSGRQFAAGGVPMIPSFLTGLDSGAAWLVCNAQNATDTTARTTFRVSLYNYAAGSAVIFNGGQWSSVGTSVYGFPRLVRYLDPQANNDEAFAWHDGSLMIYDPLIAWGMPAVSDIAKIKGLLWDAFMCSGDFATDATISFDGKTFMAINSPGTSPRGTLFVYAP